MVTNKLIIWNPDLIFNQKLVEFNRKEIKIEIDNMFLTLKFEWAYNRCLILLESDFESSFIRFWNPNKLSSTLTL